MVRGVWLGGALASLCFFWGVQEGFAQGVAVIRTTAAPDTVVADGVSTSVIRADARDEAGQPVADGTELSFQTTLGTVEPSAATVGGVAEARLLSATEPGVAVVRVTYGNVRSEVQVEFLAEAEASSYESDVITVDAGWIGYYVPQRMLVALQDVKLTYRGWEVDAKTSLFLDVETLEMLGRGVQVATARGHVEAFSLRARLVGADLQGHLLQVGEDIALYQFSDRSLALKRVDEALTPELFWPPEIQSTSFWVKGRHVLIFPTDKIALRRAELYYGQTRLFAIPYYVLSIDRFSPPLPQYVNFNSLGGLSVDIPWPYAVTENRTGTLTLEKGTGTDWFATRRGWSLGVDEQYALGPDEDGELRCEGFLRNDWGAYWSHRKRYQDGTNGYFALGYPSNRLLYGSAAWYGRGQDYTFAAQVNASKMPGQRAGCDTRWSWRSFARPLGVGTLSGFGSLDLGLTVQPTTGKTVLRQEERLTLFPKRVSLGKKAGLTLRAEVALGADSSGARGGQWVGRLGIDQSLGAATRLSLAYLYQENRGEAFAISAPTQQLSASLSGGTPGRTEGYLYSTYDLSQQYLNAFAAASQWLSQDWKMELRSQYLNSPLGDYVDNEVSLVKNIGGRAAALTWSQSRHRIWFEFLPGEL